MRKRLAAVVVGLFIVALAGIGVPGANAQVDAACQGAGVCSENVRLLTTLPDAGAISGEFSRTGEFFYVSTLKGVSAYDVSDPRAPQLLGVFANVLFENESMTYGERIVNGELRRFVILAIDAAGVPVTDPEHIHVGFDRLQILDVTDPTNMQIIGDVQTEHSTHTVQCVDQQDCRYAYNAGDNGTFEILDFTDLENPQVLKKVASPAAGPNGIFASGAGHYWEFDSAGIGWHTGSGGAVAFNVTDPTNPRPIQATNPQGLKTPYNDFILHNSRRPNGENFQSGGAPDVGKGNVLLVTEEDYANDGNEILCEQQNGDEAGTFQTWQIPDLDGEDYRAGNPGGKPSQGTIKPLDIVNAPAEFGDNANFDTPAGVFCSGHWFDYHEDDVVAQGYYQQGLWFEDVSDPTNIRYYGHYTPVASEVWDAYWVPKRDSEGLPTGKHMNIVYTVDAVRGVDVLEVDLPSTGGGPAPDVGEEPDPDPTEDRDPDGGVGDEDDERNDDGGGSTLPATGGGIGLLLLGVTLLPAAAYVGRRGRS